jgi:hypothetical protein
MPKALATAPNKSKKRVTTYPMPIFIKKKQHIVKTLAATLNKSKKRKRFFLFLDLLKAVAKICKPRQIGKLFLHSYCYGLR